MSEISHLWAHFENVLEAHNFDRGRGDNCHWITQQVTNGSRERNLENDTFGGCTGYEMLPRQHSPSWAKRRTEGSHPSQWLCGVAPAVENE